MESNETIRINLDDQPNTVVDIISAYLKEYGLKITETYYGEDYIDYEIIKLK